MTQSGSQPLHVLNVPTGPNARHQTAMGATSPRRTTAQIAKDIGLFAAAPFVTLLYVSLFPFVGMVLLAQAWRHRKQAG
jgi:hypothetical protein